MSTARDDDEKNGTVFRDCLAEVIISAVELHEGKSKKKRGKKKRAQNGKREPDLQVQSSPAADLESTTTEDLAEFVDVGNLQDERHSSQKCQLTRNSSSRPKCLPISRKLFSH